ncbi:MAG: hypothetical protein ACE5J9_06865 [Methanosarcinales archaeon]
MTIISEISQTIGISEKELIEKGLESFIEKEIRLVARDIADICERYNVASKEDLYNAIASGSVAGHPAWEDYIVWKNKEIYLRELKNYLKKIKLKL